MESRYRCHIYLYNYFSKMILYLSIKLCIGVSSHLEIMKEGKAEWWIN